jgi:glycosyltransferase involved in cell wall biosynthesis/SAM-dependent methyltransferase
MPTERRPRVLILSPAFPPWGGGGVIRMTKLAKYLPEFGWDVTVVCSDERNPIIRDDSLLADIPESVRVIRVKGPLNRLGGRATAGVAAGRQRGRLRPLADAAVAIGRAVMLPDRWIGWAVRVSQMSSAELGHPDVIISSGPPHSSHLAAARLSRRLAVPFVVDLRDDWASDPFGWNKAPWRPTIDKALERRCLDRASQIVVVSEGMRRALAARRPSAASRIELIPNGYDPADLAGLPERTIPGADDPIRFLFAGRLLANQSAGGFYQAFGEYAREGRRATLEMVGQIDPSHVAQARAAIDPAALTISDFVSHAEVMDRIAAADVLVVIILGGPGAAGNMTGKLYEYVAARRPILLIGPNGDAARMLRSPGLGVVARPDHPAEILDAIKQVAALSRTPHFHGAADSLLHQTDRRTQAGTWAHVLRKAVEGQSAGGGEAKLEPGAEAARSYSDSAPRTAEVYWDRYWSSLKLPTEVQREPGNVYGNAILDVFERHLPADSSLTAAELGGAPGQYLAFLHKTLGFHVTCIDYSSIGCQKTRENFRLLGIDGATIKMDIFDLAAETPQFDVVYSLGLIEHFEDRVAVVSRHVRLIRPGGYLVLGVPNLRGLHGWFFKRLRPRSYATHSIGAMDLRSWRSFEDAMRLNVLFKNYVGGFEPRVFRTRQELDSRNVVWYGVALLLDLAVRTILSPIRRINGPRVSGYAMAVYRTDAGPEHATRTLAEEPV